MVATQTRTTVPVRSKSTRAQTGFVSRAGESPRIMISVRISGRAQQLQQDVRSCWRATGDKQQPDLKCSSGFVVICQWAAVATCRTSSRASLLSSSPRVSSSPPLLLPSPLLSSSPPLLLPPPLLPPSLLFSSSSSLVNFRKRHLLVSRKPHLHWL